MWRRTLDSWGYSPLEQIDRNNVAQLQDGVDARHGHRPHAGGHAARLQRRDVHPEPRRRHPGDRREDRRSRCGSTSASYPEGVNGGTNRNMAIWGNTIIDASADNSIYAVDARTGNLVWETQVLDAEDARQRELGPDHRQRQGHHRPSVPARRRQRRLRHHRARRADRQGALAHAHDSAARRAGRRDLGRRADGAALARRHVDGAELRPRDRT